MQSPATIVILIVTAVATFYAFRRPDLKERWMFNPCAILRHKEYERMFTSGLIHLDWMHFGFNAISFYSFGRNIELIYGSTSLLLVYLSSILGGSMLSLIVHRNHDYRSLGASGGVCGVIFASIFLLPGGSILMFPIPVPIPTYLYAVIFLAASFVSHRRQSDNIGHDAHLGGAIVGLLVATAMQPGLVFAAPWMFVTVFGLSVIILTLLILDPLHLLDKRFERTKPPPGDERNRRYAENRERNSKLAEIDRLLEKVSASGLQSLSETERKKLDQLSKEIGGWK